jgi:hypothetical protein
MDRIELGAGFGRAAILNCKQHNIPTLSAKVQQAPLEKRDADSKIDSSYICNLQSTHSFHKKIKEKKTLHANISSSWTYH